MPSDGDARPAFYALPSGGWRDYWTLLHPPYTLWHLSYVAIGAALAPVFDTGWWLETTLAFFLAMGVAAHALDELHGHPLKTQIPDRVLRGLAAFGLAAAAVVGAHGALTATPWIWPLIALGGFLVVAYNLELFDGRFHSDLWFAVAWGAFPVVTAYVAQTGTLAVEAVLAAAACTAISAAQRALSTPVRELRRHAGGVTGTITFDDGSTRAIDAGALRSAPESALRLLCVAMPLLGATLIVLRIG